LKKRIKVLFEDEYFIVFDKPSGIVVIPTPQKDNLCLTQIVNREYASHIAPKKLHPCHRIDRDTSGAIIYAKGKHFQRLMMDKFRKHEVKKVYIAFVHGIIRKKRGEMRSYISNIERLRFTRGPFYMFAVTKYRVLEYKNKFSVVEVYPVTGRTNQIRIHFKEIGHPLVGERKYAFARDYSLKFRRAALHAHILEWNHPVNGEKVKVVSDLADDMKRLLSQFS